jgi:hypothetical protein
VAAVLSAAATAGVEQSSGEMFAASSKNPARDHASGECTGHKLEPWGDRGARQIANERLHRVEMLTPADGRMIAS